MCQRPTSMERSTSIRPWITWRMCLPCAPTKLGIFAQSCVIAVQFSRGVLSDLWWWMWSNYDKTGGFRERELIRDRRSWPRFTTKSNENKWRIKSKEIRYDLLRWDAEAQVLHNRATCSELQYDRKLRTGGSTSQHGRGPPPQRNSLDNRFGGGPKGGGDRRSIAASKAKQTPSSVQPKSVSLLLKVSTGFENLLAQGQGSNVVEVSA